MAFNLMKSLTSALRSRSLVTSGLKHSSCVESVLFYSTKKGKKEETIAAADEEEDVLTFGISRPISEILKELNKKVPDSLIRARTEPNGFSVKYIPWFVFLFWFWVFDYMLTISCNDS